MAFVTIPGGVWIPNPDQFYLHAGLIVEGTVNAAANKYAHIGRVWTPDGLGKTIQSVGFRIQAVTKGGSSDVQVSLQDVLTTAPDPDEVVDQAGLVGNANLVIGFREVTLSATRAVAFGEMLAIVYAWSPFTAGDTISLGGFTPTNVSNRRLNAYGRSKAGGSWSSPGNQINVVLGFTDGTYGTLFGATVASAVTQVTSFASNTTPDEIALEVQFPCAVQVDGAAIPLAVANNTADFEVLLYDGTTPMTSGTRVLDAHQVQVTFSTETLYVPFAAPIPLDASHTYRLALKPTTTNSLYIYTHEVQTAAHWGAHGGGPAFRYASRVDGGAWATVTTKRLVAALSVCAVDAAGGAVATEHAHTFVGMPV